MKDKLELKSCHEVIETVSKELEEAAKDYSNNLDNIYGSIGEQTRNAFKAGAKWQKAQMMKVAIDVKINRDTLYDLKPFIHEKYLDYKMGDKCKMILIKEE